MADGHQHGAENHGAALTEQTIRKPASEEWRQVNKARIKAINLRGEGLHAKRTKEAFERAAEGA